MKHNFIVDNNTLRCRICGNKVSVCETENGWLMSSSSEGDEDKGFCHDCLIEHCCETNCLGCDWHEYPDCPHIETKKIYTEKED